MDKSYKQYLAIISIILILLFGTNITFVDFLITFLYFEKYFSNILKFCINNIQLLSLYALFVIISLLVSFKYKNFPLYKKSKEFSLEMMY